MSHEGISFVSQDTARKAAAQLELSTDAIQPLHVRVNQTDGTGVEIDWKDGHTSHWAFQWLRDACPCATCVEMREVTGRELGQPKPQSTTALPMFKAPVRPNKAHAVGRYAISFDWNDGHTSGIYSWHYLRSICQCGTCTAAATTLAAKS